jgi:glycosyltransferase involved in cell wall biosynthesis
MRVLMTADAVGGVWTYCLELADALLEHDVEVTLAVMGPPPASTQRAELERSCAGAELGPYALEWMPDPWQDVAEAEQWLLGLADRVQADLVHLNGYVHGAAAWRAPTVVVAHSDVLSWHQAVLGVSAGREWELYRQAVEEGLRSAGLVVAPTAAVLGDLHRHYAFDSPELVVPNGIQRSIPVLPKRDVVLAAGRVWDEAKNISALARVAPRLSWPVLVAGEGEVAGGVRPLGRLDRFQLDRALAATSVFAAPALYEPFGLTALEAARAGCALVLGDLPSQREVWGDAALFVDPADDSSVEEALRSLIDDPELRATYATRAHDRSLSYTAGRMAAGYVSVYAHLRAREAVRAA